MVAIRFIYAVVTIAATLLPLSLKAQEVQPRIPGLEDNKEYMTLLADDARLKGRLDSLATAVGALREQFVEEEDRRKELSTEILQLESESFSLQSQRDKLIRKINTIEQEWLVVNINNRPAQAPVQPEEEVAVPVDTRKYADLTRNGYFSVLLSSTDYAMLRKAQQYETTAVQLLDLFEER